LTFFGDDFLLSLNDDNWDKCLYEGGMSLERLKNPNLSPELSTVPHPDSLKKEEVPNQNKNLHKAHTIFVRFVTLLLS
jgi:hypothetical protein